MKDVIKNVSLPGLLCLGTVMLGIGLALWIVPFQVDDAYITYRYAANMANGFGLTFNNGFPPVEGFSSPIWLCLLTISAMIFGVESLPVSAVFLGILSFILCFFVLRQLAKEGQENMNSGTTMTWSGLTAFAIFSTIPSIVFYAVTGLEHLLFLSVILVFALGIEKLIDIRLSMIAGFLAIWIRPEGGWLIVMMIFQILGQEKWQKLKDKDMVKLGASVLIGCIFLVALRFFIFESILPNTYYAKAPISKSGFHYIWDYFTTPWFGAVFIIALSGAVLGTTRHRGFFFAGISWCVAAIIEGGDWMPGARLLIPALGLFTLSCSGVFTKELVDIRNNISLGPKRKIIMSLKILLFILAIVFNITGYMELKIKARETFRYTAHLEQKISDWVVQSRANAIGSVDIGRLGFFTNIELVDFAGLTDRYIGRSPGHHLEKSFDLSYVFDKRKPDLIILRAKEPPKINESGQITCEAKSLIEQRIMKDKRLGRDYQYLMAFIMLFHKDINVTYVKLIFKRKGFNISPEMIPPDKTLYVSPL